MPQTVLILGANGRFGRHAALAFANAGWAVRRYDRAADNLTEAASGTDVIVNGWNPPYPDWAKTVPGLTRQVIDAARTSGATVLIPGNVYVYGKDAPDRFTTATPHAATNPLGRIRTEMERAYASAGIRVIILRAGDFIDTEASGNWFDGIIAAKAAKGRFSYPGRLAAPHAWAYLPDMARAAVALAEMRENLQTFEDIAFAGYTLTGQQLGDAVGRATNRRMQVKRMNWLPLRMLAPVWPTARCLLEMRYLWDKPHHLDGGRLDQLLPDFTPTALQTALEIALKIQIDPNQPVSRPALDQPLVAAVGRGPENT